MTCTCCKTPLTGGSDTFGQVGQEMCQECWWAMLYDDRGQEERRVLRIERSREWLRQMSKRMEQSS